MSAEQLEQKQIIINRLKEDGCFKSSDTRIFLWSMY